MYECYHAIMNTHAGHESIYTYTYMCHLSNLDYKTFILYVYIYIYIYV